MGTGDEGFYGQGSQQLLGHIQNAHWFQIRQNRLQVFQSQGEDENGTLSDLIGVQIDLGFDLDLDLLLPMLKSVTTPQTLS